MTPRDIAMLGQECLSAAAFVLAGCFWIRMRHVEAREQVARTEVRRLKRWGGHWWASCQATRRELFRTEAALHDILDRRSRAVSAGNRTRAQQQQARKAETTQRLERVAARKRGRAA